MEKNNLFGLPKWYFPRRFIIVALTFFAITLAYMMRSNLSIAILEMSDEFGWKATDKGMFLSSFFWGYITTQLIGGVAARRFGCKAMMAFVIIVPSMMTMLIPVLAPRSEFAFVACRVLTGVAAGGTFPTMFLLLGDWIPYNEKAFCLALVYSGVNVGTIIVDVGGPKLMHTLGWQYIFYFTGGLGFVWLILWILFGASTPSEMKSIHPVEARYIEDNFAPKSDETTPIYKNIQAEEAGKEELLNNKEALNILFNNASFWNIVIGALCLNWGSYIFLTWLPTYANEQLHFDDQMSGIIAITPSISNAIVAFISGKICDLLVAKKYRLLLVRKTFMIMGSTCYVVTLVALAYKDQLGLSNVQAAILLACGTGGGGFHLPGYTANIYDIAPYHPSLVVGISNTAGTVPGIVGVFLTGILLQNGVSWGSIWLMTASFYAAAAIIHFVFCNVKRVV